jgi:hypothetical protein
LQNPIFWGSNQNQRKNGPESKCETCSILQEPRRICSEILRNYPLPPTVAYPYELRPRNRHRLDVGVTGGLSGGRWAALDLSDVRGIAADETSARRDTSTSACSSSPKARMPWLTARITIAAPLLISRKAAIASMATPATTNAEWKSLNPSSVGPRGGGPESRNHSQSSR